MLSVLMKRTYTRKSEKVNYLNIYRAHKTAQSSVVLNWKSNLFVITMFLSLFIVYLDLVGCAESTSISTRYLMSIDYLRRPIQFM